MYNWIGSKPTFSQKSLISQFEPLLLEAEKYCLHSDEVILKAIEAEFVKNETKVYGLLILTSRYFAFLGLNEYFRYSLEELLDYRLDTDIHNKDNWNLSFLTNCGHLNYENINKNEDSKEFLDALEMKFAHPEYTIQTTVTHDFKYLLTAERLHDYHIKNIQVTPFLLKRDNMGTSKNGIRMLQELHPTAKFISEGYYEDEQKAGNFITIDQDILLYEYNNKTRSAALIKKWPLTFFDGMPVNHGSMETEIADPSGKLVISDNGRFCETLLNKMGITLTKQQKKWHNLFSFKIS